MAEVEINGSSSMPNGLNRPALPDGPPHGRCGDDETSTRLGMAPETTDPKCKAILGACHQTLHSYSAYRRNLRDAQTNHRIGQRPLKQPVAFAHGDDAASPECV